ncbi:MAG TPA: AAA family ATPase, partial [Anaerolineae bacterium]
MLRITLLGQPSLHVNASPLRFSTPPKTLPLLAYLLLHASQATSREQIAFALWPDESERAARANLRRHLHHLQNALPPASADRPWLVSSGGAVQWNRQSDFWLDVTEFERLSANPETLADAIALYGGDLLTTVYEDWLFFDRERLRELYFADMNQLILKCRSRRDFAQAIGYAQQLLTLDPLREDVVRQLMAIRYEGGDRAGALQDYQRFAQRLKQELAVTPMPETLLVYERIRQNAPLSSGPALTPVAIEYPAAGPDGRSAVDVALPFVGRELEMQQLEIRWSRAARGHGGLLIVGGEAGIGKSRLTRELSLIVETQGGRVLFGDTSPEETHSYQAFVQALRSALPLVAALDLDPIRLGAIAPLLPELKSRRALPALARLDSDRERLRLFDALAVCLEKLAQPRPVLLILEDLHWAGEGTLSLMEFLARRAA